MKESHWNIMRVGVLTGLSFLMELFVCDVLCEHLNILTQKIYVLFSLTGQIRHIVQCVYFPALCVLRQSAVSSRVSWVALH